MNLLIVSPENGGPRRYHVDGRPVSSERYRDVVDQNRIAGRMQNSFSTTRHVTRGGLTVVRQRSCI